MSYHRTQEHRALRAALIKKWKPWEKSTGPRTFEGKRIVSKNSTKHGYRSKSAIDEFAAIRAMLSSF